MKISVIIPTRNEARFLSDSVDRAWLCGADQVIVADGTSDDTTTELAESLNCVLVKSPPGRGKQMNAGAAVATGDIFLFLHADNTLCKSGCDQIRKVAKGRSKIVGAFRQSIANRKTVYRLIEFGNALRVSWLGMAYGDQGIFVSRNIFEELGGFDEVKLMEDFRFSQRLKKKCPIQLLSGPIHVSARRWERNGPIRQTILNWSISFAYLRGQDPDELAKRYYARSK